VAALEEHLTSVEISDLLIELHVRRDEARLRGNTFEAQNLDAEIERWTAVRNKLLAGSGSNST
jgi:hypothetical protein